MAITRTPKILIVGAGIGGIALAKALAQHSDLAIHLYERDSNPSSRSQGLVIGLRQEAVDILTHKFGWTSSIKKLFHPDGPKHLALVATGESAKPLIMVKGLMEVKLGESSASCLVNRADLRTAMLRALMESEGSQESSKIIYKFDTRITGYNEGNESGAIQVTLENGDTEVFDLVVGADGARSVIRNQRCPTLNPIELGIWTDGGYQLLGPEMLPPNTTNELLQLSYTSLVRKSGAKGCSWLSFVQRKSDTEFVLLWSISMLQETADMYGLTSEMPIEDMREVSARAAKDLVCKDASDLIALTSVDSIFRGYKFYSVLPETFNSPPLLQTNPNSRVTLIGDAAHKTTTQAGMGATAALNDAILLAQCIAASQVNSGDYDLDAALHKYNNDMCPNAKRVVDLSVGNSRRIHSTGIVSATLFRILGGMVGYGLSAYYFLTGK